jgi:hypothetical protein
MTHTISLEIGRSGVRVIVMIGESIGRSSDESSKRGNRSELLGEAHGPLKRRRRHALESIRLVQVGRLLSGLETSSARR